MQELFRATRVWSETSADSTRAENKELNFGSLELKDVLMT